MKNLPDYVLYSVERGACRCGRCIDAPENPEEEQPTGHTADVYFFECALKDNPDVETFRELTAAHIGSHNECDPYDGAEHSYIELGGWLGDQGIALEYMALGTLLGDFTLITPKILPLPKDLQDQMAGSGMVTIRKAEVV
jgi:hypothetical protein